MEGKHYRFFRKAPDKLTVASNVAECKLRIGKAFRLIRIEWSFNDATSKDFAISVIHPEMNQLSNPTQLLNLNDDINQNGYKVFGEKYEFEDGAELVFNISDATDGKTFSPTVYIQVL